MSELPKGWVNAKIREVCNLVNGHAFKPTEWTDSGLPIVRIQNLNNLKAPFNHYNGEVQDKFLINNGQLLFAWSGTPGTSFGAHVWDRGKAVLNQHIFKIQFNEELIDKSYLRYAINQRLQDLIDMAHGGVGLRHVTKGKFENTEIALPPTGEQHRIVIKLDSLFERTRSAREELSHIPHLIEHYKQAILAQAFDTRPRVQKVPLRQLAKEDRGIPYGIVQTGTPHKGGIPTVRAGDIKDHEIRIADLKLVSPEIEASYDRTRLRGREVIISIRGTVGNPAIIPMEMRGCNISREVAMIPVIDEVDPEFVMYYLSTPFAQEFIGAHIKGVAQSGINLRDLRELPTPKMSVGEQRKVLTVVKHAFEWLRHIEVEHSAAIGLLPRLDQAISDKAFRGELVPQGSDDEPASVLLDRIRTERAAQPKPKRGRRKARSKAAVY